MPEPEVSPVGGWEHWQADWQDLTYQAEVYAGQVAQQRQVDLVRNRQMASRSTYNKAFREARAEWVRTHADELFDPPPPKQSLQLEVL